MLLVRITQQSFGNRNKSLGRDPVVHITVRAMKNPRTLVRPLSAVKLYVITVGRSTASHLIPSQSSENKNRSKKKKFKKKTITDLLGVWIFRNLRIGWLVTTHIQIRI